MDYPIVEEGTGRELTDKEGLQYVLGQCEANRHLYVELVKALPPELADKLLDSLRNLGDLSEPYDEDEGDFRIRGYIVSLEETINLLE